jgi:pyridoxal phosphate enzyme (YggS family)
MDQLIAHFFDFAGDLFAGIHPQLDDLPDILLENAQDRVAGLEIDFALRKNVGAGERKQNRKKKKETFHIAPLCRRISLVTSEIVRRDKSRWQAERLLYNCRMSDIAGNLHHVQSQIAEAAKKSGRPMNEVELVAISKTHEAEKVRAAFDAGQQLFGESRVQEARAKIPLLPSAARWHFVGRLQRNKVRHALPLFELFHSVDSLELARDMNRIADEEGLRPRILLEVNVAGEGSKIGFAPETLREQMEAILELPRLTIEGLMTIPPLAPEAEASRKYFGALRELRDQFGTEFNLELPQLSMGMSGDFLVAIEEGATLVRVGTAIFGRRTPMRQ